MCLSVPACHHLTLGIFCLPDIEIPSSQWLREHLHTGGGDGERERVELEHLLSLARRVGKKVVIKRADDGPRVGKPSSSIESGKLVRYDIYVGVSVSSS
jgi:hypothetical protein